MRKQLERLIHMYYVDVQKVEELRRKKSLTKTELRKLLCYKHNSCYYRFTQSGGIRSKMRVLVLSKILDVAPEELLIFPKHLKGCV